MIRFFASHKVAANVLMLLMLLFGFYGAKKLNSQFLPHFDLNIISVTTLWPNANAIDIERGLIIPIEKELRNLTHVKKMTSLARNGMGVVVLEFEEKTDMSLALERTKTRVSQANNLPTQAEPATIKRIERFEPVARVLIYGHTDFAKLKATAYQYEAELLDRGIDNIKLSGIPSEQIAIQIPSTASLSLNLSLNEIADLIKSQNVENPIGDIGNATDKQEIRVPRRAETLDKFSNLVIRTNQLGERVRLRDIASLTQEPVSGSEQIFYNGSPAIELLLQRSETGSAFKAAHHLTEWAADKQQKADGVQFRVFDEKWLLIKGRLMLLIKNGGTGLLFILFILFLFLNSRIAFWTALGIPIAILATLGILFAIGGTIDMVTMFALIMTLGIIVDDTLVVSENSLVQHHDGKSPLEAVIASTELMFKPVLASSLTTVAAFLPLIVISGVIGQILSVIPITVTCVIIASLLECFLVLPSHLKHSLNKIKNMQTPKWRHQFVAYFDKFRNYLIENFIKPCISYPIIPIVSSLCIFIFSICLIITNNLSFTFFPTPDGNTLKLNASFTSGSTQATVYNYLQQSEKALKNIDAEYARVHHRPFLKMITLVTGSTADTQGDQSNKVGEAYGHLNVELHDPETRDITNKAIIEQWENQLEPLPALESLEITTMKGGPPGRDIDIQLSGAQIHILKKAATDLKQELSKLAGVSNVNDDLPMGKEQLQLSPKINMHATGLSIQSISRQLQAGFSDFIVQSIPKGREELDITVSLDENEKSNNDILFYYPIKTPAGKMIPLSNLVNIQYTTGFDEIKHIDGEASITVIAEVNSSISNANFILNNLNKTFLPQLKDKYQLDVDFAGRSKEQKTTLNDMLLGAVIGFILIYLILVLIFSSYTWPFLILLVLPMSISGSIIGHWIMQYDLTILSLFGIFGLCGIVANDAIILLTFYLRNHNPDAPYTESILLAAEKRFRPVFLTSITTIAGLSPLLFERSLQAQFLIPMTISITFGMSFALPLVLMLLPALITCHEEWIDKYHQLHPELNTRFNKQLAKYKQLIFKNN